MSLLFVKIQIVIFLVMAISSAIEHKPGLFLYAIGAAVLNVGLLEGFK